MKTISLLLDCFNDVVETFAEPVGLAVLEEVHDAKAPAIEQFDVLQQLRDIAFTYTPLPVPQLGTRLSGVLPPKDDTQIFLQDVGRAQGFVGRQGQQLFEPNILPLGQVLPVAQKQITVPSQLPETTKQAVIPT